MTFSRYLSFNEEGLTQRIIGSLMVFFPVLMLVMFLLGSHYGYERRQTKHHHATASHVGITDCEEVTLLAQAKCLLNAIDKEKDKRHAQEELRTQQHISVWTFGLFGLGVAAMFLNAFGVLLIYNTLRETRKMTTLTSKIGNEQAETSKRAADAAWESVKSTQMFSEIESRAYLHISMVQIPKINSGPYVDVMIRNVGATPAFGVQLHTWPTTADELDEAIVMDVPWIEYPVSGYMTRENDPVTKRVTFNDVTHSDVIPAGDYRIRVGYKPLIGKKLLIFRGYIEFDTSFTLDNPEVTNRLYFMYYLLLSEYNQSNRPLKMKSVPSQERAEYNIPKT